MVEVLREVLVALDGASRDEQVGVASRVVRRDIVIALVAKACTSDGRHTIGLACTARDRLCDLLGRVFLSIFTEEFR